MSRIRQTSFATPCSSTLEQLIQMAIDQQVDLVSLK